MANLCVNSELFFKTFDEWITTLFNQENFMAGKFELKKSKNGKTFFNLLAGNVKLFWPAKCMSQNQAR